MSSKMSDTFIALGLENSPVAFSGIPLTFFVTAIIPLLITCVLLVRDPLSSIPGPLLARFSPLWLIKHAIAGDMHRVSIALHRKHGKLVRTGPKEVSTNDLEAIKTIYSAGSKFAKSNWYSVWQGHRKFDLFAERDEDIHRSQRRLVSQMYSLKSLAGLEQNVDGAIRVFLHKMSGMSGQPVNMNIWAQLFAFDVVGEVTFSRRFGFMDRGADDGSIEQIDGALQSAAWIGQVPWLYWLHDLAMPYIGNYLGITARHGGLRAFAAREVEERKSNFGGQRDMLSQLREVHEKKPNEFDANGLLSMVSSNIFAGSDTTAISIGSVLYHLCKYPEAKAKLVEEIKTVHEAGLFGRFPSPSRSPSEAITHNNNDNQTEEKNHLNTTLPLEVSLKHMPYLQACLYEALRLHPAVGMTLPRVTPDPGIEIDGHFLPAGTIVGANPWVIHRDEAVFGDDVDAFRPERWLEAADEKTKNKMHANFFAFGAGSRTCLGRNLSWIEMSKLVPLLLLNFDMQLADDVEGSGWVEKCFWFVKQKGFFVRLTDRK